MANKYQPFAPVLYLTFFQSEPLRLGCCLAVQKFGIQNPIPIKENPILSTCVTRGLSCPSLGIQIIAPWYLLADSLYSSARVTFYEVGSNLQK